MRVLRLVGSVPLSISRPLFVRVCVRVCILRASLDSGNSPQFSFRSRSPNSVRETTGWRSSTRAPGPYHQQHHHTTTSATICISSGKQGICRRSARRPGKAVIVYLFGSIASLLAASSLIPFHFIALAHEIALAAKQLTGAPVCWVRAPQPNSPTR